MNILLMKVKSFNVKNVMNNFTQINLNVLKEQILKMKLKNMIYIKTMQ